MDCTYEKLKGIHSDGGKYIESRKTLDACRQVCDEQRDCVAFDFWKKSMASGNDFCWIHDNFENIQKKEMFESTAQYVKKCPCK